MQGLHRLLLLHVLTCLGQNGRVSAIVDGELVPDDSMLYMGSLVNKYQHVCGGFLVSKRFVMTAAHCDVRMQTVVFLGYHNRQDFNIYFYIKKIHKMNNLENRPDIMLLELSTDVQLGKRVQTIQLPTDSIKVTEKQMCTVAGWGKTKPDGNSEDKLRKVDVSVINPDACKKKHPTLPDNVICTDGGGTKKGFCRGDEGGPLVCNGTAVGVASFSVDKNCIDPNAPNIYTDISKYLPWIKKTINNQQCYG